MFRMRTSAIILTALAATGLACNLESSPKGKDHFIRYRSTGPKDSEPLYTLEFADGSTRQVTDDERWALKRAHIRFFDITDQLESVSFSRLAVEDDGPITIQAFPTALTQVSAVNTLISRYNIATVRTNLQRFSGFYNRYYRATTGVQSAQWLFDQVTAVIAASGSTRATVRKVTHSFSQFSVVATIQGTSAKTVVVGAHQDSINSRSPTGQAAGADDDGSGSMAILEAFRTILTDTRIRAGQAPNTLEFHWYAGEEAGLLGSQAIFQQYAREGKNVAAMLNQDMVGYSPRNQFGLITDNTNAQLNAFSKILIRQYASIGFVETTCGYACSDHASATRSGYPSTFIFEGSFANSNPNIHTTTDTIDKINFNHVLEHGKVILGFMTELAFAASI
ncbi:putative leucine aminopeptidase 1 [Paramyrothecium foliicola]|nr:putative leucine aminopeptidase 1 [Paramyrothecium foliicola]